MVWQQDAWTRIAALRTLLRPIVEACSTVRAAPERIAVMRTDPVTSTPFSFAVLINVNAIAQ
jgi:hypothetical protein